jgi:lipooligosaccharide transport system ATP-binding protein
MSIVLSASDLTKRFGAFTAVDGISFDVSKGECFGFLGPNGAGKTTTMKMITNHLPVTEGSLSVLGMQVMANARKVKARIGVVPQENNLDTDLQVLENLLVYSRYHGIPMKESRERGMELLGFFQLADHARSPIEQLSGGMQRRLLIARGLINEPEVLILDEPTTGLDPQARHVIWHKLRQLQSQGVTLIITTHYMDEAQQLCDRLVIMDHGRVLIEGSPPDLIQRHAGNEVIEVRLREDEDKESCLEAIGGAIPEGAEVECSADTLYLYSSDASRVITDLTLDSDRTILHRRATLEDVFLRLTGRDLRE